MRRPIRHREYPNLILELIETFPFLTPNILARQIYQWGVNPIHAKQAAYHALRNLKIQDRVKNVEYRDTIYIKKGKDKRVGLANFHHNQAVIEILLNCWMWGYKVEYGGRGNVDGIIENLALEVDRGNHGKAALIRQMEKFNSKDYKKVLYVSLPKDTALYSSSDDQEYQFKQMKSLIKKAREVDRKLKRRFLFTTFLEASDPLRDPLKSKIWKTIDGKNKTV